MEHDLIVVDGHDMIPSSLLILRFYVLCLILYTFYTYIYMCVCVCTHAGYDIIPLRSLALIRF